MNESESSMLDTVEERVGAELKRLREAAGLSLRTLADRAGFSASFLSQVENGQASPSIASLEKIATALNVTLADFFAPPVTSDVVLIRASERPNFRSTWSRARIESLVPAGKTQVLEAIMVTLDPGGSSGKHAVGIASDQLGLVFAGRPTLTLEGGAFDLEFGDSVLIRARTPHRWQNRQRSAAQVLLVSPREMG